MKDQFLFRNKQNHTVVGYAIEGGDIAKLSLYKGFKNMTNSTTATEATTEATTAKVLEVATTALNTHIANLNKTHPDFDTDNCKECTFTKEACKGCPGEFGEVSDFADCKTCPCFDCALCKLFAPIEPTGIEITLPKTETAFGALAITEYKGYKTTIKNGLVEFVAVGIALDDIDRKELFRIDGYDSIFAMTKEVFDISKTDTYRYIKAAKAYFSLKAKGIEILPINKNQAYEIGVWLTAPNTMVSLWEACLKLEKITVAGIVKVRREQFPTEGDTNYLTKQATDKANKEQADAIAKLALDNDELTISDAIATPGETPDKQLALKEETLRNIEDNLQGVENELIKTQDLLDITVNAIQDDIVNAVLLAGFDTLIRDANGDMVKLQKISEARTMLKGLDLI